MTENLKQFFIISILVIVTVRATKHDYQQYQNYRQLQQHQELQQQHQQWPGATPFTFSYPQPNQQIFHSSSNPDLNTQQQQQQQQLQHQPSTATLSKTWSGAPIVVVDYVDNDNNGNKNNNNNNSHDFAQNLIDVKQQSMQLTQTAFSDAAAALQLASTLQSRKPQTFNDAFVPYKHQQPSQRQQRPFHYETKTSAYPMFKNGSPSTGTVATATTTRVAATPTIAPTVTIGSTAAVAPSAAVSSVSRQARLLPFAIGEEATVAAINFRQQRPWVIKSTSWTADRSPARVSRERLERFASYAPLFDSYVKKYPHRLVPQPWY